MNKKSRLAAVLGLIILMGSFTGCGNFGYSKALETTGAAMVDAAGKAETAAAPETGAGKSGTAAAPEAAGKKSGTAAAPEAGAGKTETAAVTKTAPGTAPEKAETSAAFANGGKESRNEKGSDDAAVKADYADIMKNYKALLQSSVKMEEVQNYVLKYAGQLSPDDADELVNGLIGFAGSVSGVNFKALDPVQNDLTDGMKQYVVLMRQEQEIPSVSKDTPSVSLEELIKRAQAFEKIMIEFPDTPEYERSFDQYTVLMTQAITGGYDEEAGFKNIFAGKDGNMLELSAYHTYRDAAKDQSTPMTAKMLKAYLEVLDRSGKKIDKTVADYYRNLIFEVS